MVTTAAQSDCGPAVVERIPPSWKSSSTKLRGTSINDPSFALVTFAAGVAMVMVIKSRLERGEASAARERGERGERKLLTRALIRDSVSIYGFICVFIDSGYELRRKG